MKQCVKCPWKVSTNPHDIPNGYCETKHKALKGTIQEGMSTLRGPLHAMACHETQETACAGWLYNQLGVGNNLGVRLAVMTKQVEPPEVFGEQHQTFEDTLP